MKEFYEKHTDKVYKFFYIKSLDRATAEDLTSETFMLFVEEKQRKKIEQPTKYLYGIMRNVWIEFLKAKYRIRMVELDEIEDFESYSDKAIEDFEVSEEPITRLRPYLELLPEKQRLVLTMRIFEERSVKDTANALGKDVNYVKKTHQRALKTLRALIKEPYIASEAQL